MPWVADYTTRIPPATLKAAGVVGVCRYVSRHGWKVIGQAEYDELRAAGIEVVLNFEDESTGWLGGASAGRADAAFAADQADALGYPKGCPIPSSADFDMSAAQWNGPGRDYAIWYAEQLHVRGYEPGVYGPWDVLSWCKSVGYGWFWQAGMSFAWSGGRNAAAWPGAHLRQRYHQTVGGVDLDHNDILRDDWSGDMAGLDPNQARALGNCENILVNLIQGLAASGYITSPGAHPITLPNGLMDAIKAPGSVTLSAEQVAALVAALPSAADVAAHLDYDKLAAALAAHIHIA